MVGVGDKVEDFELPSGDGSRVKLSALIEGRSALVVACYLLDFSGG